MKYFKYIHEAKLGTFQYVPPVDKRELLFDFYLSTFLTPTGDDDIDYAVADMKETLYPYLKKELLEAVLFSITAELRHVFDNNQANLKFTKPTKKYLSAYGKELAILKADYRYKVFDREKKDRIRRSLRSSDETRKESYKAAHRAAKNNKVLVVKSAMDAFYNGKWSGGYGGEKWGLICNGWLKLYHNANTLQEMQVWIDHVYDLQHNNDTVLNKVQRYARGGGFGWINTALEFKKYIVSPYEIFDKASTSMQKLAGFVIKENDNTTLELWAKRKSGELDIEEMPEKPNYSKKQSADVSKIISHIQKYLNGSINLNDLKKSFKIIDINSVDDNGETALHWAASYDDLSVVEVLLKLGIDIEIKSDYGRTALDTTGISREIKELIRNHEKTENNNPNALIDYINDTTVHDVSQVRKLIKQVDINSTNNNGYTALMAATFQTSNIEVFNLLLKSGADPNIQKNDGWTPLMVASMNGLENKVKALLKFNPDITIKNNNGHTALDVADVKTIDLLKNYKKPIKVQAHPSYILQNIQSYISEDISKTQLDSYFKKVDINSFNDDMDTVLIMACKSQYPSDFIKIILDYGADVNRYGQNNVTALHWASINKYVGIVKLLLSMGADSTVEDSYDKTALDYAKDSNNQEIIDLLEKDNKKDPNVLIDYLSANANDIDFDTVAKLLKEVDVNEQNDSGSTALMMVVNYNYPKIVKLLIDAGADIDIINNSGKQAIDYANDEIEQLLRNNDRERTYEESSLLEYLDSFGRDIEKIKHFIKTDNVNAQNRGGGHTALHLVNIEPVNVEIAKLLIDAGADVSIKNDKGETSLDIAKKVNNPEMLKLMSFNEID